MPFTGLDGRVGTWDDRSGRLHGGPRYVCPHEDLSRSHAGVSATRALGLPLATMKPNQASAGNGAVASRFHVAHFRRAVPEMRR